jgi:hypothetical protein
VQVCTWKFSLGSDSFEVVCYAQLPIHKLVSPLQEVYPRDSENFCLEGLGG